jgi:hypothetical protein
MGYHWRRFTGSGALLDTMVTVALDSETLREQLGELLAELALLPETPPTDGPAGTETPTDILAAFGQLMDVMQRLESEYRLSTEERQHELSANAAELGEYAGALLDKTARLLPTSPERVRQRAVLDIGFGYWSARHGGASADLAPLVDALAVLANRTQAPDTLADLATVMLTLIDTAAPACVQDLDSANPGRPWRLLHLNLGIVATRAGRPDLMESAFARLVAHLPQDAAQFFHQGMQQLERVDYPAPVRAVMQDYYQRWGAKPALH